MPGPDDPREPELSPAAQRVVAAISVSIALHMALFGLVQVRPALTPPAASQTPVVIQARLRVVPPQAAVPPDPPRPLQLDQLRSPAPDAAALGAAEPWGMPQAASVVREPASIRPEPVQPQDPLGANQPAPSPPSDLPAINVPLLADPVFYTAQQVDVHPQPLAKIEPQYPGPARSQGMTGLIELRLKIDATGRVQDLEVLKASPAGVFEQSALDAFRDVRFSPAQKDGRVVNSLVEIEVRYEVDP